MPQTSLLGWFSKPASVKEPQPVKLSEDRTLSGETASTLQAPIVPTQDVLSTTKILESGKKGFSNSDRTNRAVTMPPNVELRACEKEDIPHLKRINSLLLPIPYPESFYREIVEDPLTNDITLVAIWHDDPSISQNQKGKLVGAIRCRLFAHPLSANPAPASKKDGPMLYLSTLVLLSPYRSYGIATLMLDTLIKRAANDHGITSAGAHVWEANLDGLEWYRKRGFREVGKEKDYYRRLKPAAAVVLQRDVRVMDLV